MEDTLVAAEQFQEYDPIADCVPANIPKLVKVRVYLKTEEKWFPVSLRYEPCLEQGSVVSDGDRVKFKNYQCQSVANDDGTTTWVRSPYERIFYDPNVKQYADKLFSGIDITYTAINLGYKPVDDVEIPTANEAEVLIKYMGYLPGCPKMLVSDGVTNKVYCVFSYLFPVFQLKGMLNAYDVYCRFPDKGVNLWDEPELSDLMVRTKALTLRNGIPTELNDKGVLAVTKGFPLSLTEQEWQAMAYTVIFTWSKTKTNLANFKIALEKRLSTLQSVMHWRSFDVRAFMEARLNPDELVGSGTYFDTFPRLKSTIISQLLLDDSPFASHLCFILKESQLTVFNMMLLFVRDADMTCLHAQAEIIREVPGFVETFKKIKSIYGVNWPYLKLIDPLTQITAQNKFPLLTEAARAWTLVTSPDTKTLKNIYGMSKIRPNYVRLAQAPIAMGDDTGEALTVDQIRSSYAKIGRSKHIADITKEMLDARISEALKSDMRQDLQDFFQSSSRSQQ